ncbi:UNVERIFIED_ORG: hypothetical protein J2Y78_004148 [Buttiauxella agrestis ATCC 33320]
MSKYKTIEDIETAIAAGRIRTTPQLRKALALLELNTGGNSRVSKAVNIGYNDMRKAGVARQHEIAFSKRPKRKV